MQENNSDSIPTNIIPKNKKDKTNMSNLSLNDLLVITQSFDVENSAEFKILSPFLLEAIKNTTAEDSYCLNKVWDLYIKFFDPKRNNIANVISQNYEKDFVKKHILALLEKESLIKIGTDTNLKKEFLIFNTIFQEEEAETLKKTWDFIDSKISEEQKNIWYSKIDAGALVAIKANNFEALKFFIKKDWVFDNKTVGGVPILALARNSENLELMLSKTKIFEPKNIKDRPICLSWPQDNPLEFLNMVETYKKYVPNLREITKSDKALYWLEDLDSARFTAFKITWDNFALTKKEKPFRIGREWGWLVCFGAIQSNLLSFGLRSQHSKQSKAKLFYRFTSKLYREAGFESVPGIPDGFWTFLNLSLLDTKTYIDEYSSAQSSYYREQQRKANMLFQIIEKIDGKIFKKINSINISKDFFNDLYNYITWAVPYNKRFNAYQAVLSGEFLNFDFPVQSNFVSQTRLDIPKYQKNTKNSFTEFLNQPENEYGAVFYKVFCQCIGDFSKKIKADFPYLNQASDQYSYRNGELPSVNLNFLNNFKNEDLPPPTWKTIAMIASLLSSNQEHIIEDVKVLFPAMFNETITRFPDKKEAIKVLDKIREAWRSSRFIENKYSNLIIELERPVLSLMTEKVSNSTVKRKFL